MSNPRSDRRRIAVPVCLIALSLIVYWQTTAYEFVALDDAEYVSRNPQVQRGINPEDLRWALSTTRMGNWHPLVWWSFQLDSQLNGNQAFGFHLTNVLFHTATAVLLFVALMRLGLRLGLAAAIAVLFCVHPLNVESVVWVSERKGVLSTFFWVLGMLAYGSYVRRPGAFRMACVGLCMIAGLMSKPSLVTFPFALVLLDLWPLRRIHPTLRGVNGHDGPADQALLLADPPPTAGPISWPQSLREKGPLFALGALFCVIALRAQGNAGAVASLEDVSIAERLLQIPCVYCLYVWQTIVPVNLTVASLPPASGVPVVLALVAAAILIGLSVLAWKQRVGRPYWFVGWFWFLGTMFPTCGIVPIGVQWMADRYMYVPSIGLFLGACSAAILLADRVGVSQTKRAAVGVGVVFVLTFLSVRQAQHWRDSDSLFEHLLRVDSDNHLAHSNLAATLIAQGDYQAAQRHAESAVAGGSTSVTTRNNLALCYAKLGRRAEAIGEFERMIESDPTFAEAHLNLGNLLRPLDRERAEACYRQAINLEPDYAEAHNNLGGLLASSDPAEAKKHLQISLQLWPENPDVHSNLGNAAARDGDFENAIRHYRAALQLNPEHAVARQNLQVVERLRRENRRQSTDPAPSG